MSGSKISIAMAATALAVSVLVATPLGQAASKLVLPKNSVGAKQLKKNAVTSNKLAKNAVTAAKVKNGTLLAADFKAGQLPSGPQGPKGDPGAQGLKGDKGDPGPAVDTSGYPRALRAVRDDFSEGDPMQLAVPGYGRFGFTCDDNNTPAVAADDRVGFYAVNDLGSTALASGLLGYASTPTSDPTLRIYGTTVTDGAWTSFYADDRVFDTYELTTLDGTKSVTVIASAHEDWTSTVDCVGHIQAFPSGQ